MSEPNLLLDPLGRPIPQYLNEAGTEFEEWKGEDGKGFVRATEIETKLDELGTKLDILTDVAAVLSGTLAHTKVSVQNSTTEALAANTDRRYLLLINISDADIFIKFGADAIVDEGIKLEAGERIEFTSFIDTRVVNAIAGTLDKDLLVTEGEIGE